MLCLKDTSKGNAVDNGRLISCFPLIWKLLPGGIAELYEFLDQSDILPPEQKSYRRRYRDTKEQLLIDKMVMPDFKQRRTNLGMV